MVSKVKTPAAHFTLRAAHNPDSPAVAAIVFDVLAEYGLPADPAGTDADLRDLEASYFARGGRFWVVENARGDVVGCAGLHRVDAETAELRKMYLRREARGLGLGRRLLETAIASARELGFRRLTLETATVLKEAIALYTGRGFRPVHEAHLSCRCDLAYGLDL